NLGHCLVEQGKNEEGFTLLRESAARAAEGGRPDLRAKGLFMFGRCLYRVGRKEEAHGPLGSALRIARDHDFRNDAFHAAYYLWLMAREAGAKADAAEYLEIAQKYRVRVEQRSEEAKEFDLLLAKQAAHNRRDPFPSGMPQRRGGN